MIYYNSSAGAAEEVVSTIKKLGVQVAAVQADGSSDIFEKTLVDAALKSFNTKPIDIIVNNAGFATPYFEGIKSVSFKDWDITFRINVRVLKPLSLRLVRQTRTTRTAIQKGQPRYLSLGPRRTSGPENAVDGTLCDGLLTVMEQPSGRGISHPFLLYKYREYQAQACRQR